MHLETLNLDHQVLLAPRFHKMDLDISEYTFANLYLFRNVHDYQVVFGQDLYLKGKTRDGFYYLTPTVPVEQLQWKDMEDCLQGCNFLFPIPESWASQFDPQKYQEDKKEQDSDYLYTVAKLASYPGRHLSGRRNLVKQFMEHHPVHSSIVLSSTNKDHALEVLEEWQQEGVKEEPFSDYGPCTEAVQLMETLNLNGLISYVDGKPAAFVLGEELHSKTYVIHFAKALRQYKGIYQYIYQEFARSLQGKYEYINLEQDLGVYDLQHAKRAYYPDQLIPKLRISLWKSKVS